MYYEEFDPFTGERSTFGGIAEAAAEYHARGEMCPWDCYRCDRGSDDYESWGYEPEPVKPEHTCDRFDREIGCDCFDAEPVVDPEIPSWVDGEPEPDFAEMYVRAASEFPGYVEPPF